MSSHERDSSIRKAPFYAGLFLLTLCTLTLELVQTRLLSVMTWYHLAFFVISAAMFGMTAGAVWVFRNRRQSDPGTLAGDLVRFTTWFSLSAALSLGLEVSLAPVMVWSFTSVVVFFIMALTMAAPFFFSGIAVSLALARSPFPIATVYSVDLVGAALGCLGVLALLACVDAPSAVLFVAALGAMSAVLFKAADASGAEVGSPRVDRWFPGPLPLAALFGALGVANAVTYRGLQPIVVKSFVETRSSGFLYERWNYFSRIAADARDLSTPEL